MSKQVIALSVVLGLSLIGSYVSWTAPDDVVQDGEIVLVDGSVPDLKSVLWEDAKKTVDLQRRSDDLGDYVWVTTTEQRLLPSKVEADDEPPIEPPGAEDGAEDEAPEDIPEPEYEQVVKEFKAGKDGDTLIEKLAPLLAVRKLDTAADELADFGLDEPEATLTLTGKGGDTVLKLGGEAYGTRDHYVLDVASNTIYVVEKDSFRSLTNATQRLPDRRLLDTEAGEIQAVQIQSSGGEVVLEHRNAQDPKAAFWARPGDEDEDEAGGTWLDKALALNAKNYVQAEETPTGLEQVVAVTLRLSDGSRTLVLYSGTDPDGKPAFYGRSEHTRELVNLHKPSAGELIEDIETILD